MIARLASLRRQQEGFTLIELMVVVAIIALLTTVAVPWLSEATRRAKGSVGKTDLYTFSGAMERVYLDDGSYPNDMKMIRDTKKYVRQSTTFKNRFGNPYILITNYDLDADTNTAGNQTQAATWYILVDPGNASDGSVLTLTCTDSSGAATPSNWTYNVKLVTSAAPQNVDKDTTYTAGAGEPAFAAMGTLADSHTPCSVASTSAGFDANSATVIRN